MKIGLRLMCAGLAAAVLTATPAVAKECKDERVSATSREYVSRSLGAFPASWVAWRKEVKAQLGSRWQAWRRAEDRDVKCQQARNDAGRKRWTCTRSARPCQRGTSTTTPENPDKPDGPVYVAIDMILKRGMKNEQVKTLQYLLKEQGYDVEIDGNFGRGTQKALRAFQKKSKIKVDGRAGPQTVEALTS